MSGGPATLTREAIERIGRRFTRPCHEQLSGDDKGHLARLAAVPGYGAWAKRNVHPHRRAGYAAVTLSLKKTGVPPGDVTADQMEAIAALADRYSQGELRVSHEQNLIFADVRQSDLHALWGEAKALGLATPTAIMAGTGLYWGRGAFTKKPGEILIEYLPPIAPGLDRKRFMAELEARLEPAARKLLTGGS